MAKKVFLYGLQREDAERIRSVLADHDIAAFILGDEALDETVADVFEMNDDIGDVHEAFDREYMIFQDIDLNELVRLMAEIEASGEEFEGVKVMRTENNEHWTMRYLLEQTAKEHDTARKAIVLDQLIRSCNNLDLTSLTSEEQKEFKASLLEAFMVLKSGTYTYETVTAAAENLAAWLRKISKLYN